MDTLGQGLNWALYQHHRTYRTYRNKPGVSGPWVCQALISSAKGFCRDRWHIGGVRPAFLEISAEMLNYIDFVSSCDFHYLGHTEGNQQRLTKDLQSIDSGAGGASGIMSLQRKYYSTVQKYCAATGQSFQDVIDRLTAVLSSKEPLAALDPTEWVYFRPIIRTPIPYFLAPLDTETKKFLVQATNNPTASRKPARLFVARPLAIRLGSVSAVADVPVPQTESIRIIMDSFGLRGERIQSTVLSPVSVEASSGNIILITGSSGSGKSLLLEALDTSGRSVAANVQFRSVGERSYSTGWLEVLPSDVPIFEHFSGRYGPERAFAALSQTGLSEAMLLIKPFWMLSKGQQYRAMLAELLLRRDQVWLLDEFGADLDPLTAKIVAHNFRRQVMRTNRVAFVAAANHGHYLDALRPTKIIVLRHGADAAILRPAEYRDEFLEDVS